MRPASGLKTFRSAQHQQRSAAEADKALQEVELRAREEFRLDVVENHATISAEQILRGRRKPAREFALLHHPHGNEHRLVVAQRLLRRLVPETAEQWIALLPR